MKEHLAIRDIEQILDLCMPSFCSTCKRCIDGTLTFQFRSRSNPDAFSFVGIPAARCQSTQQIRNLGELFLEDVALATADSVPEQAQKNRHAGC